MAQPLSMGRKGENRMEYAQRRKLQSEATARRILHTALELMRSQGFDQVSVRDICKAAGITTGAFYHHFPSKDALLEYGFAPLDDSVAAAMAGHEAEPPERRLWRLLSAYAEFMEDSRELIGRYYQRRIAVPGTKSMDSRRYIHQAMLDCFRQAEKEGLLAPGHSPEWVADFCFRHFRGVVIDWVLHHYSYPLLPRMREDYQLFTALFHT